MADIVTHPHVDERGNRQWRADRCPLDKACIQGNQESMTPEICERYENGMRPFSGDRIERCHCEDFVNV